MRSKFDEQLLELNKEMIEMGNKIILSIKNAIEALVARDENAAKEIMERDIEVDHLQKKIEGICFNLFNSTTTCCQRSSNCNCCNEDGNRYGENRRSCCRYF